MNNTSTCRCVFLWSHDDGSGNHFVQDLVVGDITLLHQGEVAPADGVLLNSSGLKIDESAVIGETGSLSKNTLEGDCFILAGSIVLEGYGTFVVLAVGIQTLYSRSPKGP